MLQTTLCWKTSDIFFQLLGRSLRCIRRLIFINNFITLKDVQEYEKHLKKQTNIDSDSTRKKTDRDTKEQLNYLDSKQSPGRPISSADRRMYYCLLSEQIAILLTERQQSHIVNFNDSAYILQNLVNMCCKYNNIINGLHPRSQLFSNIAKNMSSAALLAMEGNEYPFKEEILSYILTLSQKNHLDKNCRCLSSM